MSRKLLNLCLAALLSAVSTAAWALSDVGGVYQIGSAADLEEFAQLVNDGEVNANAVLTADIDRGVDGTMIGTADNRYQGTFEGAGHTIKINMYPEEIDAALFRYTGSNAVIQNLKVTGTITTSSKFAAGIVARNKGIVRGCYADVNIISAVGNDATHGGIVAFANYGALIENCLAKIAITGADGGSTPDTNCGGVVGWAEERTNIVNCLVISDDSKFDISNGLSRNIARNDGNVKAIEDLATYNADPYTNRPAGACYNNYVTVNWGGSNPATTVVPYEDLADGRICYQLNNDQSRIAWVQQIGTDPFPVPAAFGTGRVYASAATSCDGLSEEDLTFSNSGSDQAEKHSFDKYGICTACGCFNFHYFEFDDPTKFDKTDRAILLKSKEDIDVAEGWNRVANCLSINMKMAADIEYIAEPGQYIFFNSGDDKVGVRGNFNGDGHALTLEMSDIPTRGGLFPVMWGNVENLILHGTIGTTGQNTGSIAGRACMALVRNVYSDIDITSTVVGDNSSGGMFGWTGGVEKTVENCIYAGDFTLPGAESGATCARVGGFSGWTATKTYYKNCATLGNIIGAGNQTLDTNTENSQNIARNPGSVVAENVYVVNPIFGNSVSDHDKYTHYENTGGIASGELAFFLNGMQSGLDRFYQVIGTDPEPMPIKKEGGLVYSAASSFQCDGTPLGSGGYTNDPSGEPVIPPHTFEDGWCVVCGQFDENFITPVDGWYEISNGVELTWWSVYATSHADASAKLTEDIDMEGYMERYTPPTAFAGTFDGQGHTISNFVIEGTKDRQGLIGTVVNGATVKNLILDESCSISGNAFCGGFVGSTREEDGDFYLENCGFEGTVTTVNQNAAGLIGVCQGGRMTLHVKNCYVTGNIYGGRESGAICGYSGSASEVINCWSTAYMPSSAIYSSDSFTRGSAKVVNCYEADIEGVAQNKQQHYNPMAANRRTITLPLEEIASGALCYNLNGKQFREPSWFQTLEEDEHPYPFDNHEIVVAGGDKYFSVSDDDDVSSVVAEIMTYEEESLEDIIATQALLDKAGTFIDALDDVNTLDALADALDSIAVVKQAIAENAKIYQAYIDKCEEVKAYLESHTDFEGDLRTALEYYLYNEGSEPSEDNPLGTYEFIINGHTATAEEILAETERITKWLADAISHGYIPGTDVSALVPNSDFSQGNENWTNGFANAYGTTTNESGITITGVEAWNVTGDQYQTVEGMKPGYYLIGTHAAFRPSNNRYSTNYAAGIYANGIFNYFPAAIEDPVSVEEAVDGENCNLTIKSAFDLPIYDDFFSTSDDQAADNGAQLTGYVIQGPTGMAIAAKAERYPAYTIAKVGEDGKLTVGIKNPGTKYSNDWTGWSPLKITYCGDDADATSSALNLVLANMGERAQSILDYVYSEENAGAAPNFPEAMKAELKAAMDKVEGAETVEAKTALAEEFSDIFQRIYEGKQAYVALFNAADNVVAFDKANLDLIEQDEETGDWYETGEKVVSEAEAEALYDLYDAMLAAYSSGSYSTEEALEAAKLQGEAVAGLVPQQDEDGYYLISNLKEFVVWRAIASEIDRYSKGKLTADIDLKGVSMLPIGHNRGENAVHIFAGIFDGQGHALNNVYIDDAKIPNEGYAEPATLFYELQNATVRNLKLTGEMHTTHQFSGAMTRYMSGASTIENCEVDVAMYLGENLVGDASSGALIGYNGSANSLVQNVLVKGKLIGEGENPIWYVGGVAGWSSTTLVMKNSLIMSEYENVGAEGDNSQTISRGAAPTLTNVFVAQYFRGQQGTLVTPEQLASGEIAWKLNGNTGENAHWFQTLNTDPAPYLFGSDIVYYYAGVYTNDKPNPQLNAFAYALEAKKQGDNIVVSFKLNAEAESAEVKFANGFTKAVEEELTAGTYSVTVPVSEVGDLSDFTYEVAVTGKGTKDVVKVGETYKVWGPYGLAVNNNPMSKNFGQVLLAESYPEEPETGYFSSQKPGALFAFDPDFQPVNAADGTPGYYGGLAIKGESPLDVAGNMKFDLKDLRFTEDGRLFVARAAGLSNSSVYEINPEDLDEPWKPVFTGGELDEATGITYVDEGEQNRMAFGLAFQGKGEDLKMYVLGAQRSNGNYNATDYNCSIYNLGTATEWTGVPSANFEPLDGVYAYSPSYIGIHEDGQGGLWFIQSVTASATTPAIKHYNSEGVEDYSDVTSTTRGARIATTPDGNYIAFPKGNGTIVLYECNYVPMENGRIFLNPKQTLNVSESSITSVDFDYAGNLYVASGGTETFSRYAIPTENKLVVTPGRGLSSALGDVNADGQVDIADAVSVLNVMAEGTDDPVADVNGDGKVDIADFVSILNIMAEQ